MQRILSILLFTILSFSIYGRVITAAQKGKWSNSSSWDCSCTPVDGDTVIIPAGVQINVDINSPTYDNMRIEVYGTLWFDNGKKINMTSSGIVQIYPGGLISGGNGGSKITIGGEAKWDGNDGHVSGPAYIDTSTPAFTPGVLPVKLLYFTASLTAEGYVEINWATAAEINNDYFTVEKSNNGYYFETVEEVEGAGTSNTEVHYTVIDKNPYEGTSYYRLKQTDDNGNFEIYDVVAVNYMKDKDKQSCILTVYPNPCDAYCNIVLSDCKSPENQTILLQILDANGKIITTTAPLPNLNNGFQYQIDSQNKLIPGLYYIKVNQDDKQILEKLIVK